MSELPPPLLVAPLEKLSQAEREEFNAEVMDIGKAVDGVVVAVPFPVAMYHRIDGIWIPVADLGSFNSPHPHPAPSEAISPPVPSVACEDADDD